MKSFSLHSSSVIDMYSTKNYEEIKSEHFNLQEANAYLIHIKRMYLPIRDDIAMI